ncbi:MAG: hypothetical protein GF375_06505 [Candidatus Omnitrophica bacterium]|nr:hypothetical protein [Candidatus Omnitrophota bacterium]MBD3269625.1 hypothetical protein [Candidatus Omnitrophota bacterium]
MDDYLFVFFSFILSEDIIPCFFAEEEFFEKDLNIFISQFSGRRELN